MRRTALILGAIIMAGCSSARVGQSVIEFEKRPDIVTIEEIQASNLTNNDFQIQKAYVEIIAETGTEKLIANMKFQMPGTYLISMRSNSGIEAARFYITKDTILVNDRINRKLFHAKPQYLENNYGINVKFLPVILGDLVGSFSDSANNECIEGEYRIIEKTGSENIDYTISCRNGKVRKIETGNNYSESRIKIEFSRFRKEGNLYYASEINIRNEEGQETIKVVIDRVNTGNTDEIIFIPGRNYEDVILK